jgi:hypothetical protein
MIENTPMKANTMKRFLLALGILFSCAPATRAANLIVSQFGYSNFGDGTMSTFSTNAGGNPSAPANPFPFAAIPTLGGAALEPGGIAQDSAGNLYVTNIGALSTSFADPNIYEFSSTGAYKGIFATLPNLDNGQDNGSSLAFHNGNLYVGDLNFPTVEAFGPTGHDLGTVTNIGAGDSVGGIAFNQSGTMFVTGLNSNNVFQIGSGGVASIFVNGNANGIVFPEGLGFDKSNNLYVSNSKNGLTGAIDKFDASGNFKAEYATPVAAPSAMLLTKDGLSMLIAAQGTNEFGPTGGLLQMTLATGAITQIGGNLTGPTGLVYAIQTPEPASWSLAIIGGAVCLAGARWRGTRRKP